MKNKFALIYAEFFSSSIVSLSGEFSCITLINFCLSSPFNGSLLGAKTISPAQVMLNVIFKFVFLLLYEKKYNAALV